MNLIRCTIGLAVILLSLTVAQPAAVGKTCPDGSKPTTVYTCDKVNGQEHCYWKETCSSTTTPEDENGGSNSSGGESSKCFHKGKEIPCTGPNSSSWNGSCYVDPEAVFEGEPGPDGQDPEEGSWHYCHPAPGELASAGNCPLPPYAGCIWLPAGSEPTVNPVDVAWMAIAQMTLSPIEVGIVPKTGEDKLGLVGLPTWMWVENPSESTWGPITRSASEGPVTVSATAEAAEVTWDMGDGNVVVCGKGVPYQPSFGIKESPNCGHRYEHTSADEPDQAYQVVATTHWVVNWSSGSMSGTIEFDLESDPVAIRVGEMQVLVQ